jgi:hypothetical protein
MPVDVDLRQQREVNVMDYRKKICDLAVAARFLAFEVVGGKAEHFQTCVAFILMQALQSHIQRSPVALRGNVDQQYIASTVREAGSPLPVSGKCGIAIRS